MAQSTVYQFTGTSLEPVTWCRSGAETVIAADSWRVSDGTAVAVPHHIARFRAAVETAAPEVAGQVSDFVARAVSLAGQPGEWFPRLECVATAHGPSFRYYHREAPERLSEASLVTAPRDPRTHPLTKGPDLEALLALRQEVAPLGATEAVILTPEGVIAEGAYSSVVVWPEGGGDELWVVDKAIPRIPSVTEAVVVEMAHSEGVSVVEKVMRPAELEGAEVWILSALHGIRLATHWVDGPDLLAIPSRRARWQDRLLDRATPLPH